MAAELPLEKLRAYLRELTPEARGLLLAKLESDGADSAAVPAGEFILQELRRDLAPASRRARAPPTPARIGPPARIFFTPPEPFLFDDAPEYAHRGRIARAALEPVWLWICRDLMPKEAKVYSDQITRVMLTNDRPTSE